MNERPNKALEPTAAPLLYSYDCDGSSARSALHLTSLGGFDRYETS
jgi:hypothetical protein